MPVEPEAREEWNWFGQASRARVGRLAFHDGGVAARVGRVLSTLAVGLVLLVLGLTVVDWVQGFFVEPSETVEPTRLGFVVNLTFLLVLFSLPTLLWVATWYRGGVAAWRSRLFLVGSRWFGDFGWGVLAGFAGVVIAAVLGIIAGSLWEQPQNEAVETFGKLFTWPIVFYFAFAAAVGEELFFRGLLQPRIGIVPANILFGLAHLSYGTPLQVVIPLLLGFGFSWLTIKRRSLWPAIVAHFTFDLVMGALAKLVYG